jgi:hypothetical protein
MHQTFCNNNINTSKLQDAQHLKIHSISYLIKVKYTEYNSLLNIWYKYTQVFIQDCYIYLQVSIFHIMISIEFKTTKAYVLQTTATAMRFGETYEYTIVAIGSNSPC